MGPGVTGDMMTLGIHALDHVDPPGVRIDSTMAIVSANEKCGFEAILCETVEDLASVDVGTIIECDSDCARLRTRANTSATVRDVTLLRTRIIASTLSGLTRHKHIAFQWGDVPKYMSSHKRRYQRSCEDMRETHDEEYLLV
jgi:hypothetical protein